MIRAAAARNAAHGPRVEFLRADLRTFCPPPGGFDAAASLFVLDCLGPGEVAGLVSRVGASLSPGAVWLFADFVLPERGLARLRARAWLALLYAFFRWQAGLQVSSLPPSEDILRGAGWRAARTLTLQGGMIRSALFERSPGEAAPH